VRVKRAFLNGAADRADGEVELAEADSLEARDPLLSLAALPGAAPPHPMDEAAELQRFANAGRLVASVAHELRNALAAAQANLVFLIDALEERNQPALAEAASDAWEAIERALGTTKNVLNLVRGRTSAIGPVQVSEVINRALQSVASKLGSNVRLELDLMPAPPVEADESALHQALVNLLINALDAAPAAKAWLRVSVRMSGAQVRVSIADNGPGIPHALRAHLFQPVISPKPEQQGAELGLSISRALVRTFGGELTAGDGPLGGPEFALLLRVAA
jgi:C4-dicarboxylate-specific signal transduction histidine kinase